MRPPFVWNFFEDEDPTPHVLRADAAPQKCYIDHRIESVYEDIEQLGHNLMNHESETWGLLTKRTIEIFRVHAKREKEEAEAEAMNS